MRARPTRTAIPALAAIVVAGCGASLGASPVASDGSLTKDSPKSPATYQVSLHRPTPIGYRERLSSVVTKQETKVLRIDGQILKREASERVLRFVAVGKVLAVDGRGEVTCAEYLIERFVAESGGRQETVIAKGRVLTVVRGEPPVLTLDQGALSKQAQQDVDTVLPVDEPDEYTDDEIFGSKRPRAIGARWPIDRAKTAKNLGGSKMTLSARDIRGETRLVGTKSVSGIPCLELAAHVEAKVRGLPGLPPGAKVTHGTLEFDFRGLLPVDATKQPLHDSSHMKGQFTVAFPVKGKRAVLDMGVEMREKADRTPVR